MLLPRQTNLLKTFVRDLAIDAPSERLEDIAARALGLNADQRLATLTSPDVIANAVSHLTLQREKILNDSLALPSHVVSPDATVPGAWVVSGMLTYLTTQNVESQLLARLKCHQAVRSRIIGLERGHHLEALAAAILKESCGVAWATQGAADQGVDAVAWKCILPPDHGLFSPSAETSVAPYTPKVFVLASSKASQDSPTSKRGIISPAHVRELVGGWLIQRSKAGAWQREGIQILSPVQMLLVTTYRLSTAVRSLCAELGVAVWNLPTLTYLVCASAPVAVFGATEAPVFSGDAFDEWWKPYHATRGSCH